MTEPYKLAIKLEEALKSMTCSNEQKINRLDKILTAEEKDKYIFSIDCVTNKVIVIER